MTTAAPITKASKIFVAGHGGMVGSALMRKLQSAGYENIVTRRRAELDLIDQCAVRTFFATEKPDYVFMAAAKVGGIKANDELRAEFIFQNLMIETNIIDSAYRAGTMRGVFFGSSCIYPRLAPQPLREDYLLSGPLESTNEPYAIAKIAGIKMCEAYNAQYGTQYVSAMPTNLFGPNDNYDLDSSHVMPALIRKALEARDLRRESFEVWGSGRPRREFLHVDDLAEAAVFLMRRGITGGLYNIGTGSDVTIRELAEIIAHAIGFQGTVTFDLSKPDGTPRKLLDIGRMRALGWAPKITLESGIASVVEDYMRKAAAPR
jgi:GDP-L-fucose synthase